MQESDVCKGQSSVCGQTRVATRNARAGFQCRATRDSSAGMWGYAGDQPGKGTQHGTRRHESDVSSQRLS